MRRALAGWRSACYVSDVDLVLGHGGVPGDHRRRTCAALCGEGPSELLTGGDNLVSTINPDGIILNAVPGAPAAVSAVPPSLLHRISVRFALGTNRDVRQQGAAGHQ